MKIDMHVHTKYSRDSNMEPKRILQVARSRGLGGVAVIDHNTLEGGLEAVSCAPADMLVVPGMEITTELGHIVGLFLAAPIESREPMAVIEEIHAQGGIAVLPHPLGTIEKWPRAVLDRLDAIEGYNARRSTLARPSAEHGEKALETFVEAHELAALGASDAHFYSEIGRGITEVEASSAEEVKQAVLDRRTRIEGRHTLWVYRLMSFVLRLTTSA
jgi:predicted metal-dependent phosphoesterase TrpH